MHDGLTLCIIPSLAHIVLATFTLLEAGRIAEDYIAPLALLE